MSNVRAKNGVLFFDFRFRGVRCREYTKLADISANRKRMQKALDKLEQAIATGTFRYAEFFPGSKLAARFDGQAAAPSSRPAVSTASTQGGTPLFRTFIEEWFVEFQPAWRNSHVATIRSTLGAWAAERFSVQRAASV